MDDYSDDGGGCCPGCCRAADLGVHDYCIPCDTSPTCARAAQKPVSQTDLEPRARIAVGFMTAETKARIVTKKHKDGEEKKKRRHVDGKSKTEKSHDDQKNAESFDDEKQQSSRRKHHEGHGKETQGECQS